MSPEAVELHETPIDAARQALALARPGDLLVFLALSQRTEVLELVHEFIGPPKPAD